MGLINSPNIVTSGLVAGYDAASLRSFRGTPTTNLLTGVSYTRSNNSSTLFTVSNNTVTMYVPEMGTRTVYTTYMYNNYAGGSGECCPNYFSYGTGISVSGSTLYTYSIVYKTASGYTHPNFMYRYEYNSGGSYLTEGGVFNDSNRRYLGEGWYHAWGQFTTQATTATLHTYLFYYRYALNDVIYIAGASLTQGSEIPQPQHFLNYSTTKGTTNATGGGWVDLSGNGRHGELVNGPTFSSSNGGSIVFDGSNDYIDLGTSFSSNFSSGALSVLTVAKISSVVSKNTLISFNGAYNFFLPGNRLTTTYQLYWDSGVSWKNGNTSSWVTNQWYHLGWTISGTTLTFYVNGIADGTATVSAFSPSSSTRIGFANAGEYATGNIASVLVYNRALTATEVQQNFNATRDRFGV